MPFPQDRSLPGEREDTTRDESTSQNPAPGGDDETRAQQQEKPPRRRALTAREQEILNLLLTQTQTQTQTQAHGSAQYVPFDKLADALQGGKKTLDALLNMQRNKSAYTILLGQSEDDENVRSHGTAATEKEFFKQDLLWPRLREPDSDVSTINKDKPSSPSRVVLPPEPKQRPVPKGPRIVEKKTEDIKLKEPDPKERDPEEAVPKEPSLKKSSPEKPTPKTPSPKRSDTEKPEPKKPELEDPDPVAIPKVTKRTEADLPEPEYKEPKRIKTLRRAPVPVPRPPEEVIAADEGDRGVTRLKREGLEWRQDSRYKATRQPPLGVRLEHVLNFLREEDADRCIDWKTEFQEIVEYLEWLYSEDPDYQLKDCSLEVKNMFEDAVAKVKTHKLFEEFHYGITPLKFRKTTLPRDPRRLDWMVRKEQVPVKLTPSPQNLDLPLRDSVTRPIQPVNLLFPIGSTDGKRFRRLLFQSEKFYWARDEPAGSTEDMLFAVENMSYERLANRGIGWYFYNPRSGYNELSDGTRLLDDDDYSLALERGARRAGLQQALRSFTAAEHGIAATPWRRVHLPLDHSELERARAEADKNLHWEPFRLARGEMPLQLETAPYTYWWAEHAKLMARVWEKARVQTVEQYGAQRGWANLPMNRGCGGAFVFRRVDPDVEFAQHLLRECEATAKLLEAEEARSGGKRPVLALVNGLCRLAAQGRFDEKGDRGHQFVHWGVGDWELGQVGGRIRSLSSRDVPSLQLLTLKAEMLAPLQEKSKLFTIFAKRVKKILEDRGLDAPNRTEDGRLDVEDLLALMNRGCDGPVRRTKFTVTDAMCWLPRLHRQGRLIFHEDLACYGYIMPPEQGAYPETCIKDIMDAEDADSVGMVHAGGSPTQDEVTQWLYNLAVRLGLTLFRLRRDRESWPTIQPASTRSLLNSIVRWDTIYKSISAEGEDTVPSLIELVRHANPMDYHDNMTEDEALKLIRHKIVEESNANLTMLGRGRPRIYRRADGKDGLAWVRDHNWSWATKRLRGRPAPRFWSVDRWPVDFQPEETASRIRSGTAVNLRVMWDPRSEDSTEGYHVRPKLRRYGQEEKVRFRPGVASYQGGDTPLQRGILRDRITERVSDAFGIPARRPRTWGERLSSFFGASSADVDMVDTPQLPEVDPSLVPISWDPQSLPEARRRVPESSNMDVDG